MKALWIGLFLASPAIAAWAWRGVPTHPRSTQSSETWVTAPSSASASPEQIPFEVIAKGSAPQWVIVEIQGQSVPEPGSISLLALASFLLLRRQRASGK
jgi:hypothetical protein